MADDKNPWAPAEDANPWAPPPTTVPQRIADVGMAVGKGVVGLGEAAVGAADIVTGGKVGNALAEIGYDPNATRKAINEQMSPAGQADAQAVSDSKGFLPTVKEVASRPWYVANMLGESAPSIAGGGAVGRVVQKAIPAVGAMAGPIGEGAVSMGSTAEQIREETGTLNAGQTAAAVGSGAIVAGIGGVGHMASRAMKAADIDTSMLAKGLEKIEGNRIARAGKGMAVESAEEMAQSGVEQAAQNIGTGKPMGEGVSEQAAIGGVAGAAMGGGVNLARGADAKQEQNDPSVKAPPGPLQAAAAIGAATVGATPQAADAGASKPPQYGGARALIADAAQRNGVDPQTALVIASIETGGRFNADAKNPKSSAGGMFQFMDATRKAFPEVTPEQWQDPQVQAEYGAKFIAQTNQRLSQQLGRAPTTGEAYMGHLLGSFGASSLLKADPNMPVQDVVAQYDPKRAAEIVRLNGMKGLTAGEAVAKWNGIADQHAQRLGVEQAAFPFSDKEAAQMRATAAARDGQMLEVVDHPNVPGRFAALPPMGGDPNEEQPASKVPLIADLPRYDEDPSQANEAIQTAAQGAPTAPATVDAGLPAAEPGAATAAQLPDGGAVQAAATEVVDPAEQAALQQELAQTQQPRNPVDGRPISGKQLDEGNYPKLHERWNGLDLTVENKVGDTRIVTGEDGEKIAVPMSANYGYVRRTVAADQTAKGKPDRIDFYKPTDADPNAPVWVIDQHQPESGDFDEHKLVFGVNERERAEQIYDDHFVDASGPLRRHTMTELSMPEFKAWIKSGTTETMPAADGVPTMRSRQAVNDGVMPAVEALPEDGLFAGVPQAAKWAADNGVNADPVATPDGRYALAPRVEPQQLNDDDTRRVAELDSQLALAGYDPISPLRAAPSPEAALAASVAERAFGVKVVHLEPHGAFSGVAFKDRVYLAANETHPTLAVSGHEVLHTFEGTPLHAKVLEAFEAYGFAPKQQVTARQREEQAGEPVRKISRDYARNEIVADLNGAMWADTKFWGEMASRDKNMFRQVAYKFMELATKAVKVAVGSRFDASSIVNDVNAARAAIAQAWAEHLSSGGAKGNDAMVFARDPRTVEVNGQRRPIENSNGQPIANGFPAQVKFHQWFGDSKVADAQGRPMVLFHGTKNAPTEFAKKRIGSASTVLGSYDVERHGIFAAESNELAEEYANQGERPTGQTLMPLYMSVKKPLDTVDGQYTDDIWSRIEEAAKSKGVENPYKTARHIGDLWGRGEMWKLFDQDENQDPAWNIDLFKKAGFDGMRILERAEGNAKNTAAWVAFDPNQVKSATGNSGDFSRDNADIRFSKLPPIVLPDRLFKSLTVPERGKLRRDVAVRLVELFNQLPSADEMAAVAWSGKAARGWYADSAMAIRHVFGPDANRFTALLAAMSPQTSVQANLQNAANTWANWVEAGRPTGRDEIITVMGKSVAGNKLTDSVLDAWVNNSVRALSTPDPEGLVISGPKVNSFMQNLRGNVEEVTNDAWMAAFAAVDQEIFSASGSAKKQFKIPGKVVTDPGKGSGYLAMSARVREAASRLSELTGDTWSPAEVQETIWSWAKTLYELQEPADGGYGAREILDNGELRDELIAATPEFSSLLLDDKYAGQLRKAGYGKRLDDLRTLPGTGERGQPRAGGEKAPFAGGAQQGHERAAASRLDQLRDERARGEAATRTDAKGLRQSGGVRGSAERMAFSRGSNQGNGRPLEGLHATVQVDGKSVTFGPHQPAHAAARAYMEKAGLPYNPPTKYAKVDRARAERIAGAFEAMKHDPQNPVVKAAYAQMIKETTAQYEALMATGLKVEFIDYAKQGDPYGNPRNAILDVVNNNHMWVFSTRDGFGTDDGHEEGWVANNPLLGATPFEISGKPALANDLFRVVHDYFGHIKDGVGFRADGEENAWRSHSAMYSPLARRAMTTETRGQNSWLNFGPHGEANRTAKTADTHFADQKIGLLPQWAVDDGAADPAVEAMKKASAAASAQEVARFARNFAPSLAAVSVPEIKGRIKGKWTDLRSISLQALGGRQLAEIYAPDLPQLPQYQKLVQLMQAGVNDYGAKADKVARDWGKVKDERQLAELMHDSTLGQIDPSKPFVDGDSHSRYDELRASWNALTPEAKSTYIKARDMYEEHYAQVRQSIRDRIERAEGLSTAKKSEMLTRMDGQFFERIKGVYFPLARFGDYVIVVRDEAGKVASVSRAETKNEADRTRSALKGQFGLGYTVSAVIRSADFNAKRDAVGSEFLGKLFSVLDETGIGEDLQDDINQLVLTSMPDLSWAKHGIHRKGTAGFSQDARRAFAQNMFHGARYLQRVRFGDRLEAKLSEAEKYVKGRNELTDSVKAQQVLNETRKRHDLLMSPTGHPLAQALTSFGFFFHLGLSPASALVNLTQTPMVAYPVLAGKFGFGRSASALTTASKDVLAAKNDLTKTLQGDELRAVQSAIDDGTIDVTLAQDLAGIAQGNDSKLAWKMRPAMRAASYMFHHAERFNRQATFLAAYRLARSGGADFEAAVNTASDLTYKSHFDYASSNRPRVMQGDAAKVVTQFKQYSQNMIILLGDSVRRSLGGDTQAMKTLGGLLVMAGMAAGALGVPVVAQLLSLASMLGGSDDEPWDAKIALQNYLADALGQKVAETLMHGLSRLGPADISGRVSLDVYKMMFPDVNESLEGADAYAQFATGMLGPVIGGVGVGMARAAQLLGEGEYVRAIEALAPSVVRGPVKAFRFGEEGVKTKDGVVIKDEVGAAGIASQALGFRPSEVANAQEGRGAIMALDKHLDKRRATLVEQFAKQAMAGGDTSGPAESINAWNTANPTRVIGAMHIQQSISMRTRRIATAQQGVSLKPKERDVLQQGRFALEQP